jgi:sugar phosphate isomerase/epimerase
VEEAKALNPVLINVHSGHDSWTVDAAAEYFRDALAIEARHGVTMVHETHRQRLLGFPYSAAQILQQVVPSDSDCTLVFRV